MDSPQTRWPPHRGRERHRIRGSRRAEIHRRGAERFVLRDAARSRSTRRQGGPAVGQWYLKPPGPAGTGVPARRRGDQRRAGLGLTTGSASIVIADLDTGIRFDHPDLAGQHHCRLRHGERRRRLGDHLSANDGNGRDSDASDPGDGSPRPTRPTGVLAQPLRRRRTARGTARRRAGLIAAATNNGVGIASVGRHRPRDAGARARQVRRLRLRHHGRHALGGRA